jgi:hypothetical protein
MTVIAHAISAALLHFVWQGTVVAFLLWVMLATLRNGSPRLRYFAGCAALAIMIALPFLTACIVYRAPAAARTPACFSCRHVTFGGCAVRSQLQGALARSDVRG